MHDTVIRNANIVDGTGAPARFGDIAIDGGIIASVGAKAGPGRREIDAGSLLVTPGWVDIHTHYDGQVCWDPYLSPSSWHGVTTVIIGNCGVGFAPVKRGQEDYLINLMVGVEDIPEATLAAGIDWQWESFGEYLDALSRKRRAIDVGTQIPHCAVRAYVMGERGAANEDATPEDIARMAAVVRDGLKAGALGLSTSRTEIHRAKTKEFVPGTFAAVDELMGLGRALGDAGHGVFEVVSDLAGPDATLDWMFKLSAETGRPISLLGVLGDTPLEQFVDFVKQRKIDGARVVTQVGVRFPGQLQSLQSSLHPFITHRTYRSFAHLSLEERVAKMRDPNIRAQLLREGPAVREKMTLGFVTNFKNFFPLGDPPDYEPGQEMSIAARAQREGKTPEELTYDILLQKDGREVIYMPFFYHGYSFDGIRKAVIDPDCVLSLSDSGAHCGLICDAGLPTYLLTYWVRDRRRGERLLLELAVKRQTRDTAQLYGLEDRGVLAPGMKADVNVIDLANLRLHMPEMVLDFPARGRRFIQRVDGYKYTIVSGEVIFEDGEPTGALPGNIIRGPQQSPQ
ncbi:MAG: N-acyl-D-amino-acid deacylase family protein [Candidatus Binataceae bacterium]